MTKEQKQNLVEEIRGLMNKINKLNTFMATKAFYLLDRKNKKLLYAQQRAMSVYLEILGERAEINGIEFMEEK